MPLDKAHAAGAAATHPHRTGEGQLDEPQPLYAALLARQAKGLLDLIQAGSNPRQTLRLRET